MTRCYFASKDVLTPTALDIIRNIKEQAIPGVALELAPVPEKLPPNATVLAFGPYRATQGERVVSAPSVAQIVTKADIITRLTNVFQLLVEPPELPEFRYQVMDDVEMAISTMYSIKNRELVVDIETSGDVKVDRPDTERIISIAFTAGGMNLVMPEWMWFEKRVRWAMKELLENNLIITVNGKFDLSYFPDAKVTRHYDVQLAHYALYPAAGEHGLKPVAKKYFGFEDWDAPAKEHTKTATYKEHWEDPETGAWADARKYSAGSGFERIPRDMLYKYNGFDVYATWHWYKRESQTLQADPDAVRVFELLMKLSDLFMGVESRGITLDIPYLEQLSAELTIEKAAAEALLNDIAGMEVNPRSPKQVKEWFEGAGVKLKGTAEAVITDFIEAAEAEVQEIEDFANSGYTHFMLETPGGAVETDRPIPKPVRTTPDIAVNFARQLLVCRKLAKTLGTYVDGYRNQAIGDTVYPGYRLIASTTGRLGGQGASMLTIPRDKRLKRMVKASGPGRMVVGADLSQAELRVMAMESMDQWLIDAFQPGAGDFFDILLAQSSPSVDWFDLHQRVNEHTATEEETDFYNKKRASMKGVVYGKSFNRGEFAIAKALKISVGEAYKLSNAFIRPGSAFAQWRADIEFKALNNLDLVTLFGRHFQAELITKANKSNVVNGSLAFTSQSTANDICLTAALMLEPQLAQYDAWLMGTIHDAIYADAPEEHVEVVGKLIAACLKEAGRLAYGDLVPFDADWGYGPTLADV